MGIEVQNIHKRFGKFSALGGINLHVATGELVALLGPSGSGKTTLLRIIAGLEQPDSGNVAFHGEDATNLHARERKVGFVFQHYALFRHMTVFDNISFGLRVRPRSIRPSRSEIADRVAKLMNLIQLETFAERFPSQLSGGQRQRVALARALAVEPKVLLLDEPFGALDAQVRKDLRAWLRRLHDEMSITSVFVTHDQEEALEVADRVVVMNEGKIEQVGTPEEVYAHPATPFVFKFLGNVNLFHGRVSGGKLVLADGSESADGQKNSAIYIRPHLLELTRHASNGVSFKGRVAHINAAGPLVRVELANETHDSILVELTQERYKELNIKPGEEVFASAKEIKIFEEDYAI
jgi:sulfate transport system ATP-binding protein